MTIEKYVSPFIPQQFPAFYKDEGPNFIAFMKAYYEWMEQAGQTLYYSRRHLDNVDIDTTEAAFLKYFRDNYISGIPEYALVDKRLLVKHILDMYRSKGTPRAYELLFRLIFNQSIDVYIPGNYLFKPSDGKWHEPRYIETTDCPYLSQLVGKGIRSSSGQATAVVDNYTIKNVSGKLINVLYLSAVSGEFKYRDRIYSDVLLDSNGAELITDDNSPFVIGSLSAIAIENGGYGFDVGDILTVSGGGVEGKARVASTRSESGKVQFNLINGGFGYSKDAVITVATALDLVVSNTIGLVSFGDTVVDPTTGANGSVTFANSTFIQLINFSSNLSFNIGDSITSSGGATATVTGVLGGGGTGASFKIGDIVNKEIYQVEQNYISSYINVPIDGSFTINISSTANTFTVGDSLTSTGNTLFLEGTYNTGNTITVGEQLTNSTLSISGLYAYISDGQQVWTYGADTALTNANLVSGVVLVGGSSGAQYQLLDVSPKISLSFTGTVAGSTTTTISVTNASCNVIPGATITDTNTGSEANVVALTRTVDWGFPANLPNKTNLDTKMNLALVFKTLEVGTISYLSAINPGNGYTTNPYVNVNEPLIAALSLDDGVGGIKGADAVITTNVLNSNGIVSAVEVVDSGFGYNPSETVTMTKLTSQGVSVTGSSVITTTGKGTGFWRDRSGFLDDIVKIQDSYYYQNYSYEIITERMLSTYSSLVNDLVHPSGMALFGRFRLERIMLPDPSLSMQFTLTQS